MANSDELRALIYQQVAAIPYGRVASYGQIAALCGFPCHARFVGRSMKYLSEGTRLPWHRVVNSQGKLAFDLDSPAWLQQKALLEEEGVLFVHGKVNLKQFGQ